MRRWKRFVLRFFFAALMAGLLFCMVRYPISFGPTAHALVMEPYGRAVTPQAAGQESAADAIGMIALPEPPLAPEKREPPVMGDILALMYHHLTVNPAETTDWTTTPEKLRLDLTQLMEAGYRPLSVEDYARGNYERGQDYFVVTFDDGYESNLTLALPVLRELSVPATVFTITGMAGKSGHMDWDQMRELISSGIVTVYSHTETHMSAAENTLEAFLADEQTAWAQIEAQLSPALQILAYPYGAYTRASMEALAAAGYDLFVVQDRPQWYTAGNEEGILLLIRHNVEDDADTLEILARNRAAADLPELSEATALREARAAEDAAAMQAYNEAWDVYLARCRVLVTGQE